jgi:3-hydroxyisobutyrate dehydrogenase
MADGEPIGSIAVLGTGTIGGPMARNLAAAGLEVRAWNRSREKAEPLADHGVAVANSPAEAAAGADAVLTMLPDGDAVQEVMEAGALEAMGTGATWVQTSTVGLRATEQLKGLADANAVQFVDAPVLGTKQPAEEGALVVLASGPEEVEARCRPVFEAIGSKTVWLGEAGAGSRMKLVLNSWLVALVAGLAETIALARALGEDPGRFLEIIDGGPIGLPYAELKGRAMIEGDYPTSFRLQLAQKDAGLVVEAAEQAGLSPEVAKAAVRMYSRAAELGHGDEDVAAVIEAYGRQPEG